MRIGQAFCGLVQWNRLPGRHKYRFAMEPAVQRLLKRIDRKPEAALRDRSS
jgi:hypothetical protein